MAYDILKGSSGTALVFLMVESADHITGLTGASPTVTLSKNGAAFASPSGAVTEIANGWYKVAGNATDTNTAGPLALHATAASGDPTDIVVGNVIDATVAVYGANLVNIAGSAVSTTSAQLGVNAVQINGVATSSVTTINANQGTTQPVNFTGTGASALVKSDVTDIAGSAVSTSTAQLGVNLVNISGSAVSPSTAQLGVNAVNIAGQAAALDANNLLKVDVEDVNGSATVETGITFKQSLQYMASALCGVLSGAATTTVAIQAINNSGTARISATVDANGNRSAITLS